jgi:hypothetical protein
MNNLYFRICHAKPDMPIMRHFNRLGALNTDSLRRVNTTTCFAVSSGKLMYYNNNWKIVADTRHSFQGRQSDRGRTVVEICMIAVGHTVAGL